MRKREALKKQREKVEHRKSKKIAAQKQKVQNGRAARAAGFQRAKRKKQAALKKAKR